WMHATLDAHLARGDPDDLGAPPPRIGYALASLGAEALHLAPARSIGLRDRASIELRVFEGLSEGIARLG
ncbi:MAG: hypothetical protein IT531_12155, partial [Burkholderiales bacterium]|nr:hypothetical protein [Burkholderiales bacterium]